MNQTYGSPYITKDGFAARSLNILPELLPSEGELSPAFDMAGGQVWTSSFEHASNFIGTDVPSDILKASYKKNLFNKLNSNPNSDNVIFNHYMKVCNSIEGSYEQYNSILNEQISESFPNTSIGKQLEAVFKMILNRSQFPHKAQFFSCVVGGFDTHSNQLTTQATLLGEFSDAVIAFQEALEARGLSEMITTFTHSDFGRTLIPNTTDGTDHGWASHSLVLGGSVRGNQILGEYPDLSESSPYLLSRGRVVPTISTDQIHASLMNWLGVPEQGLNELFPPLTTENMDSIAPQVLPIYGSAPVDPDPGLFPGVDPWDSAMVYVEGDLVSDRDKVWVATTLTQGIKPSNKTSDWLKTIPPSAETWDEYTQYSTGVLVYSGASIWQSIAPSLGDFPRSSPEKWTKLYVVQT
jgi:hypothetical protein